MTDNTSSKSRGDGHTVAKRREHSPAPWVIASGGWDEDGNACYSLEGITDVHAADARLIAAAPDMLEALEVVRDALRVNSITTATQVLDSAIRKARGEA